MSKQLINAIADMQEEEALEIARKLLEDGLDPMVILEVSRKAMDIVGRRYKVGTYFLPELMLAGEMMERISDLIRPELENLPEIKRLGKVLIGTVDGDIHDIGKNIVTFMLDVSGFEVLDIGVDVPPQKFVDTIGEFKPQVVGLSGLLTLAFDSMKDTVEAIDDAGLRDGVKIMVGGGQVNQEISDYAGADAYGKDAIEGVALAKKWIGAE